MADVYVQITHLNSDITAGGSHPMCSGKFMDLQELKQKLALK